MTMPRPQPPKLPAPGPDATLREAQEWLRLYMANGGEICPCCKQRAQVYRRRLSSGVARVLICMLRLEDKLGDEEKFLHTPSLPVTSHESAQAQWWRLIEEKGEEREDGGRAGYWRLTDRGRAFVRGELTIPKHAVVYNGKLMGFDLDEVDIHACLGKKFDLQQLMHARLDVFEEDHD